MNIRKNKFIIWFFKKQVIKKDDPLMEQQSVYYDRMWNIVVGIELVVSKIDGGKE